MKLTVSSVVLAAVVGWNPSIAIAVPITINPSSDGSLYTCETCNIVSDGHYVVVYDYIQGVVKFSSASISGTVTKALLTLNPYGLPLWGPIVDVYGYGTVIGPLDVSDAYAGILIGSLTLPTDLNFGEDAFFDVTAFVAATDAPFLAFNLRATGPGIGPDIFSSLEYNYGHPSQLIVTVATPEPSTLLLLGVGTLGLGLRRRRRQVGP